MGWADAIRDLLQSSGGAGTASGQAPAVPNPEQTYQQAAQQAPPNVVGAGLAEAFRSNQTPSFPEMVSTLFTHSNPDQRAGLLSKLLGAAGPGALSGPLSSIFGSNSQVTPQQASQVPPQAVQQLAQHAQNGNPSIVDEIGGFYSQHPQVVQALGGLALSIAIQHMVRRA
jgi:hypothetical protein